MQGFFMSISKSKLIKLTVEFTRNNYAGDDLEDLIWLIEVILGDSPAPPKKGGRILRSAIFCGQIRQKAVSSIDDEYLLETVKNQLN